MNKKEIRSLALKRRRQMPEEDRLNASQIICGKLINSFDYQNASLLFLYADYNREAGTGELMERALNDGKRVAFPRVEGEEIRFYEVSSQDRLKENAMGIREPVPALCREVQEKPDWIVMPGVAFDPERNRIGYGKGFYDRFLAKLFGIYGKVPVTALCFECQIVEKIDAQAHDIRADHLVTERRTL